MVPSGLNVKCDGSGRNTSSHNILAQMGVPGPTV